MIKARFYVSEIKACGYAATEPVVTHMVVKLAPVYSSDKKSPNYSFSEATPSGFMELTITNKAAYDQFKVGQIYDIDFNEAHV